jgi:hypothetical protein
MMIPFDTHLAKIHSGMTACTTIAWLMSRHSPPVTRPTAADYASLSRYSQSGSVPYGRILDSSPPASSSYTSSSYSSSSSSDDYRDGEAWKERLDRMHERDEERERDRAEQRERDEREAEAWAEEERYRQEEADYDREQEEEKWQRIEDDRQERLYDKYYSNDDDE